MIAIGGLGITELIMITIILLVFVLPLAALVVIIWICLKLVKRNNPASALESRVEHLERQLDLTSEHAAPKQRE
jgi:hypothetical protein